MPKIDTDVGKLVAMIEDGELRLPEMQRRYVWPATRVRDLLDSLYRGYPSGTILVWETDHEMPSRDLAVSQGTSPFKGHKLLLDGQQRLTSLSAILRGAAVSVRGKRKAIDILFNLDHPDGPPVEVLEVDDEPAPSDEDDVDGDDEGDEEGPSLQERLRLRTFVVASNTLSTDPRWVRVSEVFGGRKSDADFLRPLVKSFDDPNFDRYSKRLAALRKIADYPYVMHVLDKNLSYEEVAEIFVRVNSLGMKLRGSDLALAQITSRWRDSLKLFEEFQEECEKETWFTLDLGLLVRALVVFATGQSRFKTAGTIPVAKLQTAWEKAKAGIRFAINFLSANAGIEDETLLSSPLFLIALGYYALERDHRLSPGEEAGIRKWLYLANARGHYTRGSSETMLDADLNIIRKGGGSAELLDTLRQHVGRLEIEPADLEGRGRRSPLFSMAYLALKARGARDWRTRLGLSLTHQGKQHVIEQHHIFPKALVKGKYDRAQINEVANMAFITGGTNRGLAATPAETYLASVLADQGAAALEAHCVPCDAELWTIEAFPKFLEYRRAALARVINEFISNDAGREQATNVDAMITAGETDRVEFKASARWDYRENKQNKALEAVIVKTVAGFLNAKGGTLLIGVGDDGEILGLDADYKTLSKRPDRDGYQQFLVALISAQLGKEVCANLVVSFHPAEGREICSIRIGEGAKPAYVKDSAQERFYVRVANTTQEMSTKESVEYVATRWPR